MDADCKHSRGGALNTLARSGLTGTYTAAGASWFLLSGSNEGA